MFMTGLCEWTGVMPFGRTRQSLWWNLARSEGDLHSSSDCPGLVPWGKVPSGFLSGTAGLGRKHTGCHPCHCCSSCWISGWTCCPTRTRWSRNSLEVGTDPVWLASGWVAWYKPPTLSLHFSFHCEISNSFLPVFNISWNVLLAILTRVMIRYRNFRIPQFWGLRSYFPFYKQSLSN